MSTRRRIPELGQPPKPAEREQRREPSLPTRWTAVPARGPKLIASDAGADRR